MALEMALMHSTVWEARGVHVLRKVRKVQPHEKGCCWFVGPSDGAMELCVSCMCVSLCMTDGRDGQTNVELSGEIGQWLVREALRRAGL